MLSPPMVQSVSFIDQLHNFKIDKSNNAPTARPLPKRHISAQALKENATVNVLPPSNI
jgi:hypothetical protein